MICKRDVWGAAEEEPMGLYDERVLPHIINVVMNTGQTRLIRARVCARLKGEVLEIGFGTGHNLPFLPLDVTRLMAVEPSGVGVRLARGRMAAAPVEVEVVGLDGQRLPVPDGSVDAVLCTWSLCTIPDAEAAVREARRVLRPGGEFHFVEHGRAPDERVRRWQDRLNGIQRRVGGGCNLNRDIAAIIESGGMRITRLDNYYGKGEPKPYAAMYEGTALPA
ncbi:MAG TPA: class I SAM-dependent methyltransferase [Mycobacteriales bacterium]|nr:class I SAM-dependent methyltransferase [Mycobacteriales bacterium]